MLRVKGACVFNFRRNEWNRRLCHERSRDEIEGTGGRQEKNEEDGEKRKGKKAGKLAQSFSGAPNPPPQQFPGHRLFVYMGSSISIYNTPSPHAAAVAAARTKVSSSGKMVFPRKCGVPTTHTMVPIGDSMISRN